jgi:hypothetical protein
MANQKNLHHLISALMYVIYFFFCSDIVDAAFLTLWIRIIGGGQKQKPKLPIFVIFEQMRACLDTKSALDCFWNDY